MIIDTHAHYAHKKYDGEFPYLSEKDGAYTFQRATREKLFEQMSFCGIVGVIEASIGLDQIENQLALRTDSNVQIWKTVGVHPTRCIHTPWKNRKKLPSYADAATPIAIGETGLDYHYPRIQQHRLRQNMWFRYQLRLADRLKLPLILHIRNADKYALPILKRYKSRLHGGVVHCFSGDLSLAKKYIALGFALGIGGKLLCNDEQGNILRETVRSIPLESILIETDAPYVLPDRETLNCNKKAYGKLRNSSMLLPMILRKIAELRDEDYEAVERAVFQNAVRTFQLNV